MGRCVFIHAGHTCGSPRQLMGVGVLFSPGESRDLKSSHEAGQQEPFSSQSNCSPSYGGAVNIPLWREGEAPHSGVMCGD